MLEFSVIFYFSSSDPLLIRRIVNNFWLDAFQITRARVTPFGFEICYTGHKK